MKQKSRLPEPEVTSLNWLLWINNPDSCDGREVGAGRFTQAAFFLRTPDFSGCNLTSAEHLRSIPDQRLPSVAHRSRVKHGRTGIPTDEKRNYATVVEAEPITQARLITKDQRHVKQKEFKG